MSRPMVKAAPGLFSTMMVWLSCGPSSDARMRATVSVALPGACGTINRIGLSGYSARAAPGSAAKADSRPRMGRCAQRTNGMALPPETFLVAESLAAKPRFDNRCGFLEHGALGNALVVGRREGRDRQGRHEIGKVIGRRHAVGALPGMADAKAVRRSDIHHQ